MFSKSSEFYDIIYSSFKDYKNEVKILSDLINKLQPKAKTILDVACGTGEHARLLLNEYGYKVDGIDINEGLLEIARRKVPSGKFISGDMTSFDLGQKYDVVMCLFSSIGYVRTIENVTKTLCCFKNHLSPEGVIIVEPWFPPDIWQPGKVYMKTAETEDIKLCRISFNQKDGNISKLRLEYLIGTKEGISHEVEDHELGLFTIAEMQQCFHDAMLSVEYDPKGIYDRGLYIAKFK